MGLAMHRFWLRASGVVACEHDGVMSRMGILLLHGQPDAYDESVTKSLMA